MEDFDDPKRVFGADIDKNYQKETVDDIIRHRQEFGDQLFIDRLLTALGIDNGVLLLWAENHQGFHMLI